MGIMKFTDAANIGKTKRTSEGYLTTNARALRSGIQEYYAGEFGDALAEHGFKANDIVKVYRPVESVKDAESLQSLSHAAVTIDHPAEDVSSENWHDLAVGEVSTSATWDGNFIALPLILKDKRAIDAVENGKAELSAGYSADLVRANHQDYDYVMGPPRYNHIAIVDKARAGSEARIGDSAAKPWGAAPLTITDKKEIQMDMKTVVVGDKAVQVAASDADVITKLAADLAAEKEAHAATKIEAADAAKQVKTPEQINALVQDAVKELTNVAEKARRLVKDYDATGKDAMTIRREVIKAVYGDEAIADLQSDAEIKAAFAVAREETKADPVLTRDKAPEKKKSAWEGMYKAKKEKM